MGWLRKAWTVRRCNDLDRMLGHHTPLSSRTSLTTRETCAPLALGSPGRALRPSSMESGSSGRVLRNCRGDLVHLLRHHINLHGSTSYARTESTRRHFLHRKRPRPKHTSISHVPSPAAPANTGLERPGWFA